MTWSVLKSVIGTAALMISLVTPAFAADYTFTYSTHATENSFRGQAELVYLEEVKKLSGGKVDFKIFWGSSLMSGPEVLNAVSSSIVDTGVVNPNYHPKELLVSNALSLIQEPVGKYTNLLDYFYTAYDEIPDLKAELDKYNNEVLFMYGVMPMTFISTQEMTSIYNLKGQKARTAVRWIFPLMQEIGAQPVSVPWADLNMALQTKVIDTVFTNLDSIHMAKLDEAAPNVLIYEGFLPTSTYFMTMNKDKFKSLPKDIQDAFLNAGKPAKEKLITIYDKEYQAVVDAQKKLGYKVNFVSKKDSDEWVKLSGIEKNNAQWIEEATKAGVKDAKTTLDKVYSIFNKTKQQ